MMRSELSVVVIGLNEGERLERSLAAIQAMHFPKEKTDLIYVDSASTDGSIGIAERFGARVIRIKPERHAPGLARNAGWQACLAPFLLFVDGDSVIHPDFVVTALKEFANPNVAVVCGSVRELHPKASIYHRVRDQLYDSPAGYVASCFGNALVRRSALERVNGYDGDLIRGEDREICWRMKQLGYVILRIDFPMARHDTGMICWRQYWRHYLHRGYYSSEASKRLPGANDPQDAPLRRSRVLAPLIFLGFTGSVGAAVAFPSAAPVAVGLGVLALFIVGAAWRFRPTVGNWSTALLCGLDFYIATLPLFLGQALSWHDKLLQRRRELKRYK